MGDDSRDSGLEYARLHEISTVAKGLPGWDWWPGLRTGGDREYSGIVISGPPDDESHAMVTIYNLDKENPSWVEIPEDLTVNVDHDETGRILWEKLGTARGLVRPHHEGWLTAWRTFYETRGRACVAVAAVLRRWPGQ